MTSMVDKGIQVVWHVRVHSEDGSLWAEVLDLPGCFASGDTMDELVDALTEAIGLYLTSKNVEVTVKDLRLVRDDGEKETDGCDYRLVPA